MGQNSKFAYGCTWVKTDFHLHTRSDKEFSYSNGGQYPEENTFPNDYIEKMKQENISIGIITNHNKFAYDEFKLLKRKAKKEGIFLLPGVELSINDGANGIHALIVFSEEWLEDDHINAFLTVIFEGKSKSVYEQKNGRSSFSFLDTIKKLNAYDRDYFIIPAHVEQDSGFFNELDGGRIKEFGENIEFTSNVLGFQKVRSRALREKVINWLDGWYPAEVEGSDCKSIEEIGKCKESTWLKIGDFTFDAVKFALIDYKNRVRSEPSNKYTHSYIKSISFTGGIFDNKTINFSPELNTLIGIRGSGKSSLLESIRYALDIEFTNKTADKSYKNDLIEHTLGSGGKITLVVVDQHGKEYEVVRIFNEEPEVYIDGKLEHGISLRTTVINQPIYFGQKDLSSSGDGFEIDLVEKLIRENVVEVRKKITDKISEIEDAIGSYQKYDNLMEKKQEIENAIKDAEFNLRKFEQYKIGEKLNKLTNFNNDEKIITDAIDNIEDILNNFSDLIDEYSNSIINEDTFVSEENEKFINEFYLEYTFINDFFKIQESELVKLRDTLKTLKSKQVQFALLKKNASEEFAKTKRDTEEEVKKLGATTIKIEEFPELKSKISDYTTERDKVITKIKKKDTDKNNLLTMLSELNNLWHEEFTIIKLLLDDINNKHESLKIECIYKGNKSEFLAFTRSTFKGSKIREITFENMTKKYSDFINIFKDLDEAKKLFTTPDIFEEYFNANLSNLLTFKVGNNYTIKYRGKELKHHSLGQRASALILFVLNQKENDLILIDQPEDDLDNQTVYDDVITLITKIKPNIQFIFATHNANFPVLGDAEQIHACKYNDEVVTVDTGSIDSPLIQDEIVSIMEGGEEAFNKRKKIYSIWKP